MLDFVCPFPFSLQLSHHHCAFGWVQDVCCSGCNSGCHWAGVLVCLSFPLCIPLSIRSRCSCCALGLWGVTAEVGTVETKCPQMALNYLITRFSGVLCIWSITFTETAIMELQSPLDTFVICVLLIVFLWQMRDEPSENDSLLCFDGKMSLKGNLLNVSLLDFRKLCHSSFLSL